MITKKYEVLPNKIRKNKTLRSNTIYVVRGEVRVLRGVRISAQDKTTIFLENGLFTNSILKRSALIFDSGSILAAKNLTLRAADALHKPARVANNGGIWFLGSTIDASKDGVTVKHQPSSKISKFVANSINARYLGKGDTNERRKDDIDGVSVLGLTKKEWKIKKISVHQSGDDGIDITNSHISLDTLDIRNPTEDGINLSSSRLELHRKLLLKVPKNNHRDRDLFDFEVDDGASYLELYRGCFIDIHGVFGDQIRLSSDEMPKPVTKMGNERTYQFARKLKNSALIYSIDQD